MSVMTASTKAAPKKRKQVVPESVLLEEKERVNVTNLPIYSLPGQKKRLMVCNCCGQERVILGHRKNTCGRCFSKNGSMEDFFSPVEQGKLNKYSKKNCDMVWDHSEMFNN